MPQRRIRRFFALLVGVAAVGVAVVALMDRGSKPAVAPGAGAHRRHASTTSSAGGVPSPAVASRAGLPAVQFGPQHLPPAWSGPLPYPVLIADRGNNRMLEVTPNKQLLWQYPPKGGLPAGTHFGSDDDAFFTPSGTQIITNEEHDGTITVIDYYTGKPVWSFGRFGVDAYGPHTLNYPDDAYRLPNGNTIVADIRNCRELVISPTGHVLQQWGRRQPGQCVSHPRQGLLGSPNGDTPLPNGDILMSLIDGNRIVLMSPQGKVIWNVAAPDIGAHGGYVSDAQMLPDGNVLVADYNGMTEGGRTNKPQPGGRPGKVIIFNPHTLKVVWMYDARHGSARLNHPSLAEQLPNGNIMLNDDYNDRVIVIDYQTKKIVWQYGHTGQASSSAGYLRSPDGFAVDYFRNWKGWLAQHPAATPGPHRAAAG